MHPELSSTNSRGRPAACAALVAPTAGYVPLTKVALLLADATCVLTTLVGATVMSSHGPATMDGAMWRVCVHGLATVVFAVAGYGCGLYEDARLRSPRGAMVPALVAVSIGASIDGAMLGVASVPALTAVCGAAAGLLCAIRLAYLAAARHEVIGARCVVVGAPEDAAPVLELARRHPHAAISVVGVVQPPGTARPRSAAAAHVPVLGPAASLEAAVRAARADLVVLASSVIHDRGDLLRALRALRYSGVNVLDYTALHEQLACEVPLDDVDDDWLFLASTGGSRLHARYSKRAVDVLGALVLLVPASVAIAVAAVAVRATSRGPAIFRQERLGLGGRPFFVLKLRTMYEDAERFGPAWSSDRDPRITPVGRILRKFRIDELPQLVNVLRGEMSLIGPRPERAVFSDKISATVPLFSERLMVRPGITGWAQVMAPYASSVEDSQRKLQFDLYYAKHMSLGLDLVIAAKTVKTMLFGREREQGGMVAGRQLAAGSGAVLRTSGEPRLPRA